MATYNKWQQFRRRTQRALRQVQKGKMDAQTLADTLSEAAAKFGQDPLEFSRQLGLVTDVLNQLQTDFSVTPADLPEGFGENMPPVSGKPSDIMPWLTEQAFAGRNDAIQAWQDAANSPFMADLESQITGGMNEPLVSENDLSKMLAASSDTLSQSYLGDMAGLQNQMGGLGIDPSSGIAQELGAALRFGTLQEQARSDIQTKLDVKQLNRSALENMLQMGLGLNQQKLGVTQGLSGALLDQMPFDVGLQYGGFQALKKKANL